MKRRRRAVKNNSNTLYKSVLEVYGAEGISINFTLTEESLSKLSFAAQELQVNQSVLMEAVIREGLEWAIAYYKASKFYPTTNKHLIKSRHNSPKIKKMLRLSGDAIIALDRCAKRMQESRSEVLECAIRGGAIAEISNYLASILLAS